MVKLLRGVVRSSCRLVTLSDEWSPEFHNFYKPFLKSPKLPMNLICLLLKASWFGVAIGILTGLLSGASSASLIALINLILRGTTAPSCTLLWSFVGLSVVLFLTTAISQIVTSAVAQQVIVDLHLLLTRQILACPLHHLEVIGIPRLLATLTEDVEVIANASFFISLLGVNVALLIGCLLYLSWLSFPLFVLLLVCLIVGIVSNQWLIYRGRRFLRFARNEKDRLFQHFRTATEGIKELKLHQQRRREFLSEDLQTSLKTSKRYRVTAANWFAIGGSWGLVSLFIPIGLLLFVVPRLSNVSPTLITSNIITFIFMITPIRGILNSLPELIRANVALAKIKELELSLATHPTEQEFRFSLSSQPVWSSLQLAGVTHVYRGEREDNHFTLGPIDLSFRAGELVFVIGGNGSGKSTFVKLITGLYTPETGTIQFDGKPITDENREWYRQQFSVVFADFYLFDRLLGLDVSNQAQNPQTYLEKLQLNHKVTVMGTTLSTTALSQGQRKRLALLTTYLENRSIYVFDEWASDQDPVFKQIFYTQLLPELRQRGKTVIAISHDDRYFDRADRIIKLDYGRVEFDKRLRP